VYAGFWPLRRSGDTTGLGGIGLGLGSGIGLLPSTDETT
jgi:hypothetical protein